ncbi:MAG: glutamate racemase [Flavobacteriales bacterium]|nr:glutamate racemase [Flavobacteriales bacterium]|tara:strand:- start:16772 stop:17572 length:801 start_codon:yes stop_codon:yes gene_type:complete
MRNSPIGIFDSGIGGLTVANAIKKVLPNEKIIYFGDTEHLPYGEKSKEAIQNFSKKIISFLVKKRCKIIVIACNSASSVADNNIYNICKGIPIFNVIDPVITEIVEVCSNYNIGVIGTKATIRSQVYEKKIKRLCNNANVNSLATPLLAPMIEEGFINEEISHTIINNYLSNPILNNIDHLILACTHYPLIHNEISNYYKGKINVIDSAYIVAQHIKNTLKKNSLLSTKSDKEHHFYVSNYTVSFEKSAKFFFKEDLKLEEVSLFI